MLAPRSWFHLPRRTVRLRLTALYGGLFLVSGAVLLAINYGLVVGVPIRASFVVNAGNTQGIAKAIALPAKIANLCKSLGIPCPTLHTRVFGTGAQIGGPVGSIGPGGPVVPVPRPPLKPPPPAC